VKRIVSVANPEVLRPVVSPITVTCHRTQYNSAANANKTVTEMNSNKYLFDNKAEEAGTRFSALSEIFDRTTFAHIERIGIRKGWNCWEVGAGATSVITWLADQVGATGHVLATGIDTSWAENAASDIIEVRQHDVCSDIYPKNKFDLVHARLVLVHLSNRAEALERMINSLRPGGWLLIEDADVALQPLACIDGCESSTG